MLWIDVVQEKQFVDSIAVQIERCKRDKVEVCDKVGLDYSHIWKLMHRGKFPRSRLIGDKRVMWLESEVDQWIADLPKVKLRKGDHIEESAKVT